LNELGLLSGKVRNRVEGVSTLPGLEGRAPRLALGERADPATHTTIKVEVLRRCVDDLLALLCNGLDIGSRDPDEDERVRREGHGVVENHLLPYHRGLANLGELTGGRSGELVEGLDEGLAGLVEGSLRLYIRGVAVGVDLVASNGEVLRLEELGGSCQELAGELGRLGRGKTELARGRFCMFRLET
jgi:hypothetical protein